MTLNWVKDRLWKGGACTKPVPLGQATGTSTTCPSGTSRLGQVVLVPVGQAGCLYQTCPTGTRKGQKSSLLVPRDKSYTHAGGLSLSRDKLYTHDGACPSSTCPNLLHKVGLQGRELFPDRTIRYHDVSDLNNKRNSGVCRVCEGTGTPY